MIGCSGIRITSAPPAIPLITAIQPVCRPITSTDHHAVVRLGGRVQAVDRLGRDRHGGVEAEGVVGGGEVVVDRLRHADDREVLLPVEPGRDAERVLAPDRDERVERGLAEVLEHAVDRVRLEGVRPRGADDRPAPRENPRDLTGPERLESAPRRAPSSPARIPSTSCPWENDLRPTALMTAFRPGQSPPPVRTPMRTGPDYAEGGNRTHTARGPPDFESGASTNSATSALALSHVNGVLNRRLRLASDRAGHGYCPLCTRVHPICRRRRSIEKAQFACALRVARGVPCPYGGGMRRRRRGRRRRWRRRNYGAAFVFMHGHRVQGRGRSGLSARLGLPASGLEPNADDSDRRSDPVPARPVGLEGRRPQDRLSVV